MRLGNDGRSSTSFSWRNRTAGLADRWRRNAGGVEHIADLHNIMLETFNLRCLIQDLYDETKIDGRLGVVLLVVACHHGSNKLRIEIFPEAFDVGSLKAAKHGCSNVLRDPL